MLDEDGCICDEDDCDDGCPECGCDLFYDDEAEAWYCDFCECEWIECEWI